MKKSMLYKAAGDVATQVLALMRYDAEHYESLAEKSEYDEAAWACYEAIKTYLENVSFLPSVQQQLCSNL